MKKVFIFALMAAGLVLGSCQRNELDPISGDYLPSPDVVTYTKLVKSDAQKDNEGRWIFTLDLANEASNTLHAVIVGNKYYLTSNSYTEATDAAAKNGNFIKDVTTVNGKAVKSGRITVKEDAPNYTVSGVLFTSEASYKFEWRGELTYVKPPLPAPAYYYSVAEPTDVTDAQSAVVEGVKANYITLTDLEGNFAAQFDLILTDGATDFTGRYPVKEYASEDHTAGNGFDLSPYIGQPDGTWVIGSYYLDADGKVVVINPGDAIEVSFDEGHMVFETNSGLQMVADEYVEPEPPMVVGLTDFVSKVDSTKLGTNLVVLELGTPGFTHESGTGAYLHMEVYSEDGKLASGVYTPSVNPDVAAAGEFKTSATCLWVVDGQTEQGFPFDEGELKVACEDDYYVITITSDEAIAKYSGKFPSAPKEVLQLTEFLSLTNYNVEAMGFTKLVGVELGTEGFTYTPADWVTTWTPTYTVDGQFLKLEVYAEDGTIAPGTYTPSADPNTLVAGEFKTGSDGWGGANGSALYTVKDGAATYVCLTDGTVEVSVTGNVYTIEVKSSNINAKFVGKLSNEEDPVLELKEFLSLTNYNIEAMGFTKLVGVELGTEGFTYTPADWVTTWTPTYTVDGQFLKLEVYAEDGTVAPGTYTPSADPNTLVAGEFKTGSDGWGGANGSALYTVKDGAATYVCLTDGTVTVSKEGDVYTIEVKSTAFNAKYVGKLSAEAAGGIVIDGDMSDWAAIEGVTEGTHTLKVTSDETYIYLYSMRANSGRFSDIWGGVGYVYFGFNTDNNYETGDGEKADWGTGKWETLILTYPYAGTSTEPAIADAMNSNWWVLPNTYSIANLTFKGVVTEAGAEVEYRIPRADIVAIPTSEITIDAWGNKDLSRAIVKVTL